MRIRAVAILAGTLTLLLTACSGFPLPGSAPSKPSNSAPSVIIAHIQPDWNVDGKTIKPTAIVLHWWADWGNGHDIDRLVNDSKGNLSTYNPELKSTAKHPNVGHVSEQVGVTGDGKAYQLTPELNTFARHAKCANSWAIGIEIEGSGPGSEHYIGDNKTQLNGVIAAVKELMAKFDIKAESVVAEDGRSGSGIVSHKMVDVHCQWADHKPAGSGKTDVDDGYLKRVLTAVGG
jgi:hypothetical protein